VSKLPDFVLVSVQPLEIDEFIAELKNVGIKIVSKDIIDFLDEQVTKLIANHTV